MTHFQCPIWTCNLNRDITKWIKLNKNTFLSCQMLLIEFNFSKKVETTLFRWKSTEPASIVNISLINVVLQSTHTRFINILYPVAFNKTWHRFIVLRPIPLLLNDVSIYKSCGDENRNVDKSFFSKENLFNYTPILTSLYLL